MSRAPRLQRPRDLTLRPMPRLTLIVGPTGPDILTASLTTLDAAFALARQRIARKGRQP